MDGRAKELARIVVEYSTKVRKGEVVLIQGMPVAAEFMQELARLVIDRGAFPIIATNYPEVGKYFLQNAAEEQLARVLNSDIERCKEADVVITIAASEDPFILKDVNPERMAKSMNAKKILNEIIQGNNKEHKGKRWFVVSYPAIGEARISGMSVADYADILFSATNIDWEKKTEEMRKIKEVFDNAKEVRIVVHENTDIRFSLEGRGGFIANGYYNMPDGEICFGPVEDSANGHITFAYPGIFMGNEVRGIKLIFKNGDVVKADASENKEVLSHILNFSGAKRLGEFGIGCNNGITKYMKNLAFDEKIGGTVHLALGDSFKDPLTVKNGGGLNSSPIHWDLVCELRKVGGEPGGQIFVDGRLVQENGKWRF